MRLTDFDYVLPDALIAQEPLPQREQARLMVIDRKAGSIRHDVFANIGAYLPANSVIVLNNSKVVPARLLGVKDRSGGQVEIFLLGKQPDGRTYEALLRPARRLKDGDVIRFDGSRLQAEILDVQKRLVRFNRLDVLKELFRIGRMPLPPYIKRQDRAADREFYQTVYARHPGSVAAPTAGLHFTRPLLARLRRQGHATVTVTLHVNYGTFKPVEEADITRHQMHRENYSLSSAVWESLRQARQQGRKVTAVGTTSCRVLESAAAGGRLRGETNLFIYPGYIFKVVDVLVTNFHLPRSTLLMLVYAFGGMTLMKRAYQEAIREPYRFYSYGDAMIIL